MHSVRSRRLNFLWSVVSTYFLYGTYSEYLTGNVSRLVKDITRAGKL